MATRIEISKNKLARLEDEFESEVKRLFDYSSKTNGQPMNDKTNGNVFFRQIEKLENSIFSKQEEIRKQKGYIEMLEDREFKKRNHLTANGGLQTSIHNLDALKGRKQNARTKNKIRELESVLKKYEQDKSVITESTQSLVDNGVVTRWEKKPI